MSYKIIDLDQKSPGWFAARESLITGSAAKKIKTSYDYRFEMLANLTTPTEILESPVSEAMQWGIEKEPEAREAYAKSTKRKIKEVGFIQNGRYGLSPDGVVLAGKKISRAIEIKCPSTKNHVSTIVKNEIPKLNLDQIIHYFVVIDDLKELDFVSYDPRFQYKQLHIITVKRSDFKAEIAETIKRYEKFVEKLDADYQKIIAIT